MSEQHNWTQRYKEENARLLAALGALTAGGIVEASAHIGATSVPGLTDSPCIDLAVAVWPFPLNEQARTEIATLGYHELALADPSVEQRFRHHSGDFQLRFVEPGSEHWQNFLLLRDYLRHDDLARQRYQKAKLDGGAAWQAGKDQCFAELLPLAQARWIDHVGFAPVATLRAELASWERPWWISSGWALDLFVGRVTRVHHDIDVVIDRADQLALREYLASRGWQFVTPLAGKLEPWPPHMRIELPRHQIHAHREGEFIDFLLTDFEPGVWRYRRAPQIIRTLASAGLTTADGLRYLAPELVLLFKSKSTSGKERGKDGSDFRNTLPQLNSEQRAWLRWALIALDPQHVWLEQL